MANCREAIMEVLRTSGDFVLLSEIYAEMKRKIPDLCDDSIRCPWCKQAKHPKWQHQCRTALAQLKQRKLVEAGQRGCWRALQAREA